MVKKNQLQREFESFAKKVAKLESLKKELDALDTKGFETDVRIIRAKSKNISAIPQITRELSALKRKIRNRDKKRMRVSVKRSVSSKALKESKAMKKRIFELEKLIVKKRRVSVKRQLSKQEVSFVRDVPRLERKLDDLKRTFEEHTKASRVRVDAGVGVIVDSKLGDFISEIKGELTKKLKEKEFTMDKQLRQDLGLQQRIFAQKYRKLVDEYHNKFRDRVHDELKKEVRERFEKELERKLNQERDRVIRNLIREDIKRLSSERAKMTSDLRNKYNKRQKVLNKKLRDVRKKEDDLLAKAREHERAERKVRKDFRKIKDRGAEQLAKLKVNERARFEEMKEKSLGSLKIKENELRKRIKEMKSSREKEAIRLNRKLSRLGKKDRVRGSSVDKKIKSLEEQKRKNDKAYEKRKRELEKSFGDMRKRHASNLREQERVLVGKFKELDQRQEDMEREFAYRTEKLRNILANERDIKRREIELAREREHSKFVRETKMISMNLKREYLSRVAGVRRESDIRMSRLMAQREDALKNK